eukprot:gene11693-biopygen7528
MGRTEGVGEGGGGSADRAGETGVCGWAVSIFTIKGG